MALAMMVAASVALLALCWFFVPYALLSLLAYFLWTQHPETIYAQPAAVAVAVVTVVLFFFHGNRVVINIIKDED